MTPRITLVVATLASAVAAAPLGANPANMAPPMNRAPMIQMTTPHSAVLTWRTTGPTVPFVRYGPAPDGFVHEAGPLEMSIRVSPDLAAPPDLPRLHSAPANTYQYEAYLTGLEADTVYYYGIFNRDELLAGCSEDHYLRTQPPPDTARPLRFWITGDTGFGSDAQVASFAGMQQFVAGDGRALDAFLHLGDMAYTRGRDPEFQANFFQIYADLLRNTVVWPTMGNHEGYTSNGKTGVGPYYDAYVLPKHGEAGGVPSGTEAYYSFDLGPVHFVCLNSYDVPRAQAATMGSWLERDLAQNDSEWLVGFWHHPPYTKGTHNSDTEDELIEMREYMLPILEAHGVDLVLCGHSHVYERSMLIDGAYATPTVPHGVILDDGDGRTDGDGPYLKGASNHPHGGTIAVVAGHGATAYRFGWSEVMRVSMVEIGSVLLDIEGDTATVRMIDRAGQVRDEFQLVKRGEVLPRAPLPDPWSPFGPFLVTADRHPGQTELHIHPRPLAADAVVHYTLDGSEPSTDSPVYAGPLVLSADTVVKALSTWRGGARVSPASMRTVLVPPLAAIRTLRLPVVASEDDAAESVLGLVETTGHAVGVDAASGVQLFGARFRDVPIPPNATIFSATIQLAAASAGTLGGSWRIEGDASPAPAPFSPSIGDLSLRPRTAASATWEVASWPEPNARGFTQVSPNLGALVQEIIDGPDWQDGDALAFLFSGTSPRLAHAFDGKPHLAPELNVFFDPRDPLTFASDLEPAVTTGTGLDGSREVFIEFPVWLTAAQRGIAYGIEGSPDLTPGSWAGLPATFVRNLPGATLPRVLARYRVTLPAEARDAANYFLRVRVAKIE